MDDIPAALRAAETKARGILDRLGVAVSTTPAGWVANARQLNTHPAPEAEIANDVLRAGQRYRRAVAAADQRTIIEALDDVAILSAWFAAGPSRDDKARKRAGGRASGATKRQQQIDRDRPLIELCEELRARSPGLSIERMADLIYRRHEVNLGFRSAGQVAQRLRRLKKQGALRSPDTHY